MPTIIPASPEQAADIARQLLDAADSPDDVVTTTAGSTVSFAVPDDVAARAGFGGDIPDPEEGQDESTEQASAPVQEPPRSGKGSGVEAWQAFLTAQGIAFPADAERGDLIALWDAHKEN